MAYELNFTIPSCHAPWGGDTGVASFTLWGRDDLEDAAFKWVFYDPETLTEVFALENAVEGSQGMSATWYPDMVHKNGQKLGALVVVPQIDEAAPSGLEGLPFDGINDLVLGHTLYIKPDGKLQTTHCYGTVTIKQGAPD